MANLSKPVIKRDALGRTLDQRSAKIETAVKQANASIRSSKGRVMTFDSAAATASGGSKRDRSIPQ